MSVRNWQQSILNILLPVDPLVALTDRAMAMPTRKIDVLFVSTITALSYFATQGFGATYPNSPNEVNGSFV
jgi:hypothetical protein